MLRVDHIWPRVHVIALFFHPLSSLGTYLISCWDTLFFTLVIWISSTWLSFEEISLTCCILHDMSFGTCVLVNILNSRCPHSSTLLPSSIYIMKVLQGRKGGKGEDHPYSIKIVEKHPCILRLGWEIHEWWTRCKGSSKGFGGYGIMTQVHDSWCNCSYLYNIDIFGFPSNNNVYMLYL